MHYVVLVLAIDPEIRQGTKLILLLEVLVKPVLQALKMVARVIPQALVEGHQVNLDNKITLSALGRIRGGICISGNNRNVMGGELPYDLLAFLLL